MQSEVLKPETVDAIKSLLETFVPEFNVLVYNKKKVINEVLSEMLRDPIMTRVKLSIIYTELKKLAENGGL